MTNKLSALTQVGLIGALSITLLAACARGASPLPGDSVTVDGGIRLSPPRLSTAPSEARDGLGPIESRLFPPELVMEHQGELGITDAQKQAIVSETERVQSAMLRLQWELQGEKEKLVKLLDGDRVDEARVQQAAARVMDRERDVKAAHLGMLVRIKNLLTSEQQAKLREIRAAGLCAGAARIALDGGAEAPAHPGTDAGR